MNANKKPLENKRDIKIGEHVFIAGMTGSGKTVVAKYYLAGEDNVIILDTKGTFDYSDVLPNIPVFEKLSDLMSFEEGKAIYRPRYEELNKDYYEAFFKWIYFRTNTIVLVDELMSISTQTYCPEYLKAILTRGRERKTSAWCCTQRPATIPIVCFTESTHFFIFRLNNINDRRRLVESVGCLEFADILPKYVFWYYNIEMDEPIKSTLKLQ